MIKKITIKRFTFQQAYWHGNARLVSGPDMFNLLPICTATINCGGPFSDTNANAISANEIPA